MKLTLRKITNNTTNKSSSKLKTYCKFAAATFLLITSTAPYSALAKPINYQLDTSHSFITIIRKNYGFSNPPMVASVEKGLLIFDERQPEKSRVHVEIPTASIQAFDAGLNKLLQSTLLFDSEHYPTIVFDSAQVKPLGNKKFSVSGNLSIRGVTKPITLLATMNAIGINPRTHKQAIGFDAKTTLKRSSFGMDFNSPNVSDDIQLIITCQGDAID